MNQPGKLLAVRPFDTQTHDGYEVEAAFLDFNDWLGRPTSLYAARCIPHDTPADARLPVVLHLPGGGQIVNPADLTWWARRGFASVSLDWQIGAAGDPARKTRFAPGVLSQGDHYTGPEQPVLPIAIEGCGVLIDWMTTHPRIDPEKIGVTGISWGGFLTWALNAYEPRLKAAVPVYGCGGLFLPGHGYVLPARDGPVGERYRTQWDAMALGDRQLSPVCYLSSTNDFFGYHTTADLLLDGLKIPHRRSSVPNNNHHIGPDGAATGLAWFRHYLAGGPPLPPEPTLSDDWSIDLGGATEPVVQRDTWWTPSPGPDDCRCWWRGRPARIGDARLAFGRVRYASGVTLNTPTRRFDNARPRPLDGDTWPDAMSGFTLGIFYNTQYYFPGVAVEPVEGDPTRSAWSVDRPGAGRISVGFRGLADPRWVAAPFETLEVALDCLGGGAHRFASTACFVMPDGRRVVDTGSPQVTHDGGRSLAVIRLSDFLKRPADATWADLKQLNVDADASGSHYIVGPIRKRG